MTDLQEHAAAATRRTGWRAVGWRALVLSLIVTIFVATSAGTLNAQEGDLGELGDYIAELDAAIRAFDPTAASAEADELFKEIRRLEEAVEDDASILLEADGRLTAIRATELEDLVALARLMPLEDEGQRAILGAHVPGLREILERVDLPPEWEPSRAIEAVRKALGQDMSLKSKLAEPTLERMRAELVVLDAGSTYLEELRAEALAVQRSERLRRSVNQAPFNGVFTTTYGTEMHLRRAGERIVGEFDYNNGQVVFEITDHNKLEGFWIEDDTGGSGCTGSKLGRSNWGRLDITFADDYSSFSGEWYYCGGDPSGRGGWTGDRLRPLDPGAIYAEVTDLDLDLAFFEPGAPANASGDDGRPSDPVDTGSGDLDDPTAPAGDAAGPKGAGAAALERLAETVQGQVGDIRDAGGGIIELGSDDIGALVAVVPGGTFASMRTRDGRIELVFGDGGWRALFIEPKVDSKTGELSVDLFLERRGILGLAEIKLASEVLAEKKPELADALDVGLQLIEDAVHGEGFVLRGVLITDEGMSVRVESAGSR